MIFYCSWLHGAEDTEENSSKSYFGQQKFQSDFQMEKLTL